MVSLLTPAVYNSAYFEHAFLADEMGVELIEEAIYFSMKILLLSGQQKAKTY